MIDPRTFPLKFDYSSRYKNARILQKVEKQKTKTKTNNRKRWNISYLYTLQHLNCNEITNCKKKKIEFKLFGFVAKLCPIFSNCVSIVCSINRCTFPLKIDYSSRCKNSPESCDEKRSIGWQRTCVSNLWTLAHLTYNAMTIYKHRNKFATLLSTLNIYALKGSHTF